MSPDERDRDIETLWIFYSKTIDISEILVTIVIVFLWQNTLNFRRLTSTIVDVPHR